METPRGNHGEDSRASGLQLLCVIPSDAPRQNRKSLPAVIKSLGGHENDRARPNEKQQSLGNAEDVQPGQGRDNQRNDETDEGTGRDGVAKLREAHTIQLDGDMQRQVVVASTLDLFRDGSVTSFNWLDRWGCPKGVSTDRYDQSPIDPKGFTLHH